MTDEEIAETYASAAVSINAAQILNQATQAHFEIHNIPGVGIISTPIPDANPGENVIITIPPQVVAPGVPPSVPVPSPEINGVPTPAIPQKTHIWLVRGLKDIAEKGVLGPALGGLKDAEISPVPNPSVQPDFNPAPQFGYPQLDPIRP